MICSHWDNGMTRHRSDHQYQTFHTTLLIKCRGALTVTFQARISMVMYAKKFTTHWSSVRSHYSDGCETQSSTKRAAEPSSEAKPAVRKPFDGLHYTYAVHALQD